MRATVPTAEKIIYYRDGVSEGQFEDILNLEMTAIQRACKELEPGYEPGTGIYRILLRHSGKISNNQLCFYSFAQKLSHSLTNG